MHHPLGTVDPGELEAGNKTALEEWRSPPTGQQDELHLPTAWQCSHVSGSVHPMGMLLEQKLCYENVHSPRRVGKEGMTHTYNSYT